MYHVKQKHQRPKEDDTTFFLKNEKSVIELMKTFDIFLTFSALKLNKSNCEIDGLAPVKGVKLALCGMECIDLIFNAVKILGDYYSCDKNSKNKENFINLGLKIGKTFKALENAKLNYTR